MSALEALRRQPSSAQDVVIDWSRLASDVSVEELIAWVKTSPRGQAIHVYIPSLRRHAHVRMLHFTLQSLGCTVMRRSKHHSPLEESPA